MARVRYLYSEKATNFCEISTVDLSYVRYVGGNYLPYTVKSTMEILQNFVAFSEYMNLTEKKIVPIVSNF